MNIRPSILLLALLAAGCASTQGGPAASGVADSKVAVGGALGPSQPVAAAAAPAPVAPSPAPAASAPKEQAQKNASSSTKLYPGNDQFFKRDKAPAIDPVLAKGDKVALNFENVTVSNLATALLGDLLRLNYTIDAGGETVVSLHTRQPLLRSQVLDVLDAVLLPHDLAIVRDNAGVYHVTKRTVTVGARPVRPLSTWTPCATYWCCRAARPSWVVGWKWWKRSTWTFSLACRWVCSCWKTPTSTWYGMPCRRCWVLTNPPIPMGVLVPHLRGARLARRVVLQVVRPQVVVPAVPAPRWRPPWVV